MALYINERELIHRICNGFVSHDGYVNGEFFDIYKRNGIDVYELGTMQVLDCIMAIIEAMENDGIQIYPKELRGSKIRDIRKSQNKSVNWVALKTGLSKTAIYDIEYGLTKPRLTTLEKIAKALKVKVDDLG